MHWRRLVESEAICEDLLGATVPLHQFLGEFPCCSFVSAFGNNGFQHLTFVIDGTPEVVAFAVLFHEYFVHAPLPFGEGAQVLNTLPTDLSSKHRAKPVPPIPDSFVTHVDASLVQQVFDTPKREQETDVKHHRKTDDLGTGFKVFERGRSGRGQKLCNRPARHKSSSPDKTIAESCIDAGSADKASV